MLLLGNTEIPIYIRCQCLDDSRRSLEKVTLLDVMHDLNLAFKNWPVCQSLS